MLWVHATLVATSLPSFRRFVAPLPADEAEAYSCEMALVAQVFGLPRATIPATLGDFREYLRDRLASPEICVTAPARDVAAVILEAPLPTPLRVLAPVHRLATAALLLPRLREEYELDLEPRSRRAARGGGAVATCPRGAALPPGRPPLLLALARLRDLTRAAERH
jgi:uncharacterized protein (DUF2236 family)